MQYSLRTINLPATPTLTSTTTSWNVLRYSPARNVRSTAKLRYWWRAAGQRQTLQCDAFGNTSALRSARLCWPLVVWPPHRSSHPRTCWGRAYPVAAKKWLPSAAVPSPCTPPHFPVTWKGVHNQSLIYICNWCNFKLPQNVNDLEVEGLTSCAESENINGYIDQLRLIRSPNRKDRW